VKAVKWGDGLPSAGPENPLCSGLEDDGSEWLEAQDDDLLLPQPIRPPLPCETAVGTSQSISSTAVRRPEHPPPSHAGVLGKGLIRQDTGRMIHVNSGGTAFSTTYSADLRKQKVAAMEYLCRAQEERERQQRAEEKKRTEQLDRLKREKEDIDTERWAEQIRMEKVMSIRSQGSVMKRHAQATRERREAVADFLAENGFIGASGIDCMTQLPAQINAKRKKLMFSTYPLHVAAEKGDAIMIRHLLQEGANTEQRNTVGRTAAQVARRKNKDGSHDQALRALGEEL